MNLTCDRLFYIVNKYIVVGAAWHGVQGNLETLNTWNTFWIFFFVIIIAS